MILVFAESSKRVLFWILSLWGLGIMSHIPWGGAIKPKVTNFKPAVWVQCSQKAKTKSKTLCGLKLKFWVAPL